MKYRLFIIAFCMLVVISSMLVNSCKKSHFERRATPRAFAVPEGFPSPAFDFSSKPVTEEGFQLGRKLFWDNRLAKHADVTCGSCHQQLAAFTTFDHDLGHGTNHQHTRRNVPVIFNMAWHGEFGWDGGITNFEDQLIACMIAPERMGETVDGVSAKLSDDETYRSMFKEAFGDEQITEKRISSAFAQFVLMLVSADSKYDKMKAGKATFNSSEENGYSIFRAKCASCHTEPLFTDLSYRNNGLPVRPMHLDYGRMEVTGNANDSLKFKVPSLRNIAITGYFGHDGRYPSFTQMLDHYRNGIVASSTLDPLLVGGIPLSDLEKFYLQEFLFTLMDSTLLSNSDFHAP